jgi:asparagine synthetase A
MHEPIKVKSPNYISKWHMGFNLAFKGLNKDELVYNVMKGHFVSLNPRSIILSLLMTNGLVKQEI